jgi:hypothetical protein
LQRVGANLLGVVFNDVELKRLGYNYQYYRGYYSGHYYQDSRPSAKSGAGRAKGQPQRRSKAAGSTLDAVNKWIDRRIDRLKLFK